MAIKKLEKNQKKTSCYLPNLGKIIELVKEETGRHLTQSIIGFAICLKSSDECGREKNGLCPYDSSDCGGIRASTVSYYISQKERVPFSRHKKLADFLQIDVNLLVHNEADLSERIRQSLKVGTGYHWNKFRCKLFGNDIVRSPVQGKIASVKLATLAKGRTFRHGTKELTDNEAIQANKDNGEVFSYDQVTSFQIVRMANPFIGPVASWVIVAQTAETTDNKTPVLSILHPADENMELQNHLPGQGNNIVYAPRETEQNLGYTLNEPTGRQLLMVLAFSQPLPSEINLLISQGRQVEALDRLARWINIGLNESKDKKLSFAHASYRFTVNAQVRPKP